MKRLSDLLDDYLQIRRKFGVKYKSEGRYLRNFVSYAKQKSAYYITTDIALDWAVKPKDVLPSQGAKRLGVVRLFAKYLKTIDSRNMVPSLELLPFPYRRKSPYIYTDNEINNLLEAAGKLKSKNGLRAKTCTAFFGMIAVTGMRVCEAISLDRKDVDFANRVLTIHRTKFGKTRLVPIHPTSVSKLEEYAFFRDQIFPKPTSTSFFISSTGKRLTDYAMRYSFIKCSQQIGLRCKVDSRGPRLHDLRHSFSVKTMLRWYKEGANVEQQIPKLSTFLGHVSVKCTYWYLSANPELLQLAANLVYGPEEHTR